MRPAHDAWTHTSRGRALDLLSPSPTDVDMEEVARALGYLCRYAGGVLRYYSVAEHSVLLCDWLLEETGDEALALAGLLHDVAEAYTGDMTWPMQVAVFGAGDGDFTTRTSAAHRRYRHVQAAIERAILAHLGLAHIEAALHCDAVRTADKRILLDERAALLTAGPSWDLDQVGLEPLGVRVWGWGPQDAGDRWLMRLRELLADDGGIP